MSDRKEKMLAWLSTLGYDVSSMTVASADASFRQYFRIFKQGQSFIVMDAPPENESCDTFISQARALRKKNINAPEIMESNLDDGFLVLTDFGDDLLLTKLNEMSCEGLYGDAMGALLQMQVNMPTDDVVEYSVELLDAEMDLFKEWFLEKLLGIELNQQQIALWQQTKQILIQSAVEQPQVYVHRDFHSRNLLVTKTGKLGVIDFQDAVKGPITYDLVSLLRDCYIDWPEPLVDKWAINYYEFVKINELSDVSGAKFMRWFNLMGAQRHLKAIGIFSRLKLRDNKQDYLKDIPRTLHYLKQVSMNEMSLVGLYTLINELGLVYRVKSLAK